MIERTSETMRMTYLKSFREREISLPLSRDTDLERYVICIVWQVEHAHDPVVLWTL
jgi:hypothetical protein